jgi:hypothetical protein
MNPVMAFLVWSMSLGIPIQSDPGPVAPLGQVGPLARINIEISAADDLKSEILRHVAMGFHSVGGVHLTEENPQWTIKVVTLGLQDGQGQLVHLGLSVVVLEHGPQMDMLRALTQAWHYIIRAGLLQKDQPLEVGMRQLVNSIDRLPRADDLAVMSQHRMTVIKIEELPDICGTIATDFAQEYLRPADAEITDAAQAQ